MFSRNGKVLITLHDRSIKVWNPQARSLKVELPVETDLGFATPLALSDDGTILAVGSNPMTEVENAIRLWDLRSGKLLGVCKGHTQGVRWLAFSADGETLASVSDDSTLRFWNVRTQQELLSIRRLADPIQRSFSLPTAIGSSPGPRAGCGCWMRHEIAMRRKRRLWNVVQPIREIACAFPSMNRPQESASHSFMPKNGGFYDNDQTPLRRRFS